MSRRYHSVGSPPRDEDSPESHSRSRQLPPGNQSSTAGGTSWPPAVQQLDRNVALTVLRIGLSLRGTARQPFRCCLVDVPAGPARD